MLSDSMYSKKALLEAPLKAWYRYRTAISFWDVRQCEMLKVSLRWKDMYHQVSESVAFPMIVRHNKMAIGQEVPVKVQGGSAQNESCTAVVFTRRLRFKESMIEIWRCLPGIIAQRIGNWQAQYQGNGHLHSFIQHFRFPYPKTPFTKPTQAAFLTWPPVHDGIGTVSPDHRVIPRVKWNMPRSRPVSRLQHPQSSAREQF
jgi:hypothetical protein